ncbi:hypothetical protein FRX31_027607 [Thalictrum thalictroides]|uniref:DUF4283 domain-containing protein n=1 Tax=Thalictrum thalictroides TaxID=46969 RepID=A0A7J6VF12_THATH|nr:hypothetical protein FRX31_027607 [Thalictrum thalictroides]
MDMIRVGNNKFVCRIHMSDDLERVVAGQPWQIMGCIVLIEAFSSPTSLDSVVFNRVPLWFCFKGLQLEHFSLDTVRYIATEIDVGQVINVLPDRGLPDSIDGFRIQVWHDISKPLLKGIVVNTLMNGNIWVKIKYNNLPGMNCKRCMFLGHNQHNCHAHLQVQPDQNTLDLVMQLLLIPSVANYLVSHGILNRHILDFIPSQEEVLFPLSPTSILARQETTSDTNHSGENSRISSIASGGVDSLVEVNQDSIAHPQSFVLDAASVGDNISSTRVGMLPQQSLQSAMASSQQQDGPSTNN